MSDSLNTLGTGSLLKELQAAQYSLKKLGESTEPEVTSLSERLDDLLDIVSSFDQLATRERRHPSLHLLLRSATGLLHLQSVVESTAAIIDECTLFVRPVQSSVEAIAEERADAGYSTHESRLENQAWYEESSNAFGLQAEVLRALFTAVNLLQHQNDAEEDGRTLDARSSMSTQLHFQIGLVEQKVHISGRFDTDAVRNAIQAAKSVTVHCPPIPNQHFVIGRPVRTYFTGRRNELAQIEEAFHDATVASQQRFVIYGLSGSGKTELAFKFADSYRHKFWGIFFVDGSSQKNASSSYAEIATLGGVEPNEKAAKNWLMTRALPWLLILDNVDADEVNIDDLLPQGAKGCVLITTRNPTHMTCGNAGKRHLELLQMEAEEAETLLIKAAEEPQPWPKHVVESASSICQALGFLPLALIQASKAILNGICEWAGYLTYYDRHIQRIRRSLHGRGRSRSGHRRRLDDDRGNMNVFSSYEILYESLESSPKEEYQDAVELLHVFSYFHFQNIRLDILINAAINPLKEAEQQKNDDEYSRELEKKLPNPRRKPWMMVLRELRAFVLGKMATPRPLPEILKNRDQLDVSALEDEVQIRLRHALRVLIERSLVTRQDRATGRYSMHRLVHKWVRERPEMSTWHQALWCQISMTTLASSIRRPPHGDTETERQARRELLPHIRYVQECQAVVKKRLEENATAWRPIWPVKETYGRLRAEQDVVFSRVFAESGHFSDARELQERAWNFVAGRLGPDHPLAIWLSLFLTKTVWEMSEIDKATQMQRQAHQLCVTTWGDDHPLTLDITDALGSALFYKGRWGEARSLHASNTEKMKLLYGEKHEKTLKSIRNLGRVCFRHMDYEEATRLYQIAWDGMREVLGETHLETLISLEDLAMSHLRYGIDENDSHDKEHLARSHENLVFVVEQRREALGEEHPYTLLSTLFLARLKSHMGQEREAERMIRKGLAVAERNVGKEHIAILMAKTIYAEVLSRLGQFAEAEALFSMLTDKVWYRHLADEDGDHPDRLAALWLFAECLERQGKLGEALARIEELLTALPHVGGNGLGMDHKMLPKIRKKAVELREKVGQTINRTENDELLVEI